MTPEFEIKFHAILYEIFQELNIANEKFPPMHSAHEGYAVVLEEVRELEKEVFVNQKRRDNVAMRKEFMQTAAMCIRSIIDLNLPETENKYIP